MKIPATAAVALAVAVAVYFGLSSKKASHRSAEAPASRAHAAEVMIGDQLTASGPIFPLQTSAAPHPAQGETRAPAAYLPAERRVLIDQSINADVLDHQLETEKFKGFIDQFEKDSTNDALASQLTNSTRVQIERQLQSNGSQHLDRFACGLTLCAGSIRALTGSPNDWWQKLGDGKDVRVYVFYDANIALGARETEQRFVFSIDPKVRSFFLPSRLRPSADHADRSL